MAASPTGYDFPALLTRAYQDLQQGWCQHGEAVTDQDEPCQAHDPDAVRWCATGALQEAFHHLYGAVWEGGYDNEHTHRAYYQAEARVLAAIPYLEGPLLPPEDSTWEFGLLEAFNDHEAQTQERLLAVFRIAIAQAKGPGPP